MGDFCQAWAAIMAEQVGRTRRALVLLRDPGGAFTPAAYWPGSDTDLTDLADPARRCLTARRALIEPLAPPAGLVAAAPSLLLAYPLDVRGELRGVVVLDVVTRTDPQVQTALRALHWGMGWLDAMLRGDEATRQALAVQRSHQVMDALLRVSEAGTLKEAGQLAVDLLAERLGLARAALGLVQPRHDDRIALQSLSATAWFDGRSAQARRIENAMEEAWDQRATVTVPARNDRAAMIDVAHRDLLSAGGHPHGVVSVVVMARGQAVGVLLAEHHLDQPLDADALAWIEAWALALGPVLALHRDGERWLAGRLRRHLDAGWAALRDPRRPSWRAAAALLLVAAVALVVIDGNWRISAPAAIEGSVQRALVVPFDGFLQSATVKAGQQVKAGDLLATLDERDLLLERDRHSSERERHERRYRDALSRHERAEARMAAAEMAEAQAQLSLVDERLARARITAPFDGIVISGDWSQQLGSPLEKGKLLFEVAPLDAFRVLLKVDESDIRGVAPGQRGQLVLAGLTGETLGFVVRNVSTAAPAEGRNAFDVEAVLDATSPRLRPGMEGVGKIEAGERRLLWIWTHRFTDWVRLTWWEWLP